MRTAAHTLQLSSCCSDIVFNREGHLIISSFDLNQLVRVRILGTKGFHTVFSRSPLLDGPVGMAFDKDYEFLYGNHSRTLHHSSTHSDTATHARSNNAASYTAVAAKLKVGNGGTVSSFGNDRVLRLDASTGSDRGWFG